MIMGMSGTALSWGDELLQELRPDFDVIAYDHRGVGASTASTGRSRSASSPPTPPACSPR